MTVQGAGDPQLPDEVQRWTRRAAVGLTVLAALLFLRPVLADPLHLALGGRVSEGPSHLWGLWTASLHLLSEGPFVRTAALNYPDTWTGDLIDPVSLVVYWPALTVLGGGPVAATLAWNLLHLTTVLLAGWGGYRLAQRVVPDPLAGLVVVAACAASPYMMASAQLGRSEYLAAAWYPLHLAFLHAHLSRERRWTDTLGAILTLVGLSWSGWTLALWVAALEVPIALAFSWQLPSMSARIRRLAEVAVPALLGALPFLITVLRLQPWWLDRLSVGQTMPVVLVMPLQNLVRFLHAWQVGGGLEVAPYPGTVIPLLLLVGVWMRPRQALPWALLALVLGLLALGPEIQLAGTTGPRWRGYAPAAWLMALVPPTQAIQNWPRIASLMAAPLGVAAALALAMTGRRKRRHQQWICLGLGALIVLDHATWAPAEGEQSFQVALPQDHVDALGKLRMGPILELPIDNDKEPAYAVAEDMSLLWQVQHERPTSEVPSPRTSAAYKVSLLAVAVAWGAPPQTDPCANSEASRLVKAGFVGVLLQKRRMAAEDAAQAGEAVSSLLGDPVWESDTLAAWSLPETAGTIPTACEAPLRRNLPRPSVF